MLHMPTDAMDLFRVADAMLESIALFKEEECSRVFECIEEIARDISMYMARLKKGELALLFNEDADFIQIYNFFQECPGELHTASFPGLEIEFAHGPGYVVFHKAVLSAPFH